jgi:hypothetical protein
VTRRSKSFASDRITHSIDRILASFAPFVQDLLVPIGLCGLLETSPEGVFNRAPGDLVLFAIERGGEKGACIVESERKDLETRNETKPTSSEHNMQA